MIAGAIMRGPRTDWRSRIGGGQVRARTRGGPAETDRGLCCRARSPRASLKCSASCAPMYDLVSLLYAPPQKASSEPYFGLVIYPLACSAASYSARILSPALSRHSATRLLISEMGRRAWTISEMPAY